MRSLAIVLALAVPVAAAAKPIPIRLADGASWTMTTTHERVIEGDPTKSFSVTVVKKLTWRAAKGGGLLREEPVSATANSGIPAEAAFTQTLSIPVDFEVGDDLSPTRIRNADETRQAALALIAQAGGDPKGGGWTPETRTRILDAMVQALVAKDLQMLSSSQGTDLDVGKWVEAEGSMENPFGGPPLKSTERMSLESYDPKFRKAVVVLTSDVDPKSFVEMGRQAMRGLAPGPEAEALTAAEPRKVEISTRCRSEIDLATGLSRETKCETTRNLSMAAEQRTMIDRWTITQTLPGNP